ncbi:GDSL-type esterase/lipase family protein [Burkholderiaceae bacterium UC74_6]
MGLALHLLLAAEAAQAADVPPAPSPTVDSRLQAFMGRLAAGELLTVATLGGSITTGYAAQPPREKGYAALLARALGSNVKLVNAGVSGTDSAAAVQRVNAQVLAAKPDLVIVEFGVNDQWLDPAVRTSSYEALLRRIMNSPSHPAVLVLALTQARNQTRDAVEIQLKLARHYGLTALDFGTWADAHGGWAGLYDEPVHPNARGHERIAQAIEQTLRAVAAAGNTARSTAHRTGASDALPAPVYGRAHEFTRMWSGEELKPWRNTGFARGGEVHPEWTGQQPGWMAKADDATASFLVWGSEVAIFHAESEHYRNLEAWVDDGPAVTVRGQVPERHGYLGWHYTVIGRGLEAGAHLLHVRMKRDEWAGSGRPASLLAVMGAGIFPPALQTSDFVRETPSSTAGLIPATDARLRLVGRSQAVDGARLMAWSGTEIRARFTGKSLALRFQPTRGKTNYYTVEIDGRRHLLALTGDGAAEWRLREALADGEHELRILKRSEASQAESLFIGLRLSEGGLLLAPPAPRPLRFAFYGDSITAGACDGDIGTDQYDDLSSHDGTRAYGAVTAAKLGADYLGFAVSGIGITAAWDPLLMPQVWHRYAPYLEAPVAPVAEDTRDRAPDVVFLNLGQNDYGFPHSQGRGIAADFAPRYLAFVRELRARYPAAKIVLLVGGMTAWKEEPAVLRGIEQAARTLRAEGDNKVWSYRFEAFAYAHPRIDVHQLMAEELSAFLQREVLNK